MPPVMFSVITKYHKGRHSLFLYNSEIFYAFTQDILRSLYVLYLTKSEGNKATYEIKKEAYNLIARRDEVKKLINALSNPQLINTNNPKDIIQRDKAIELANKSNMNKSDLEEIKDNINDTIKEFFDDHSISISPKDFKDFYNVSKDTNGNYLHGLQSLAIYVAPWNSHAHNRF